MIRLHAHADGSRPVVITAAGGGHTGRALALAERLAGSVELAFIIVKGDEWSRKKLSKYGKIFEIPRVRAPNEHFVKGIYRALLQLPVLTRLFAKIKPCVLVSTGAGIGVSAGLAAKILKIPIYNIESIVRFIKPSMSARLLRPLSKVTVLHWEEQLRIHPSGRVYGPIFEKPKYKPWKGDYILVTGGTHGFKKLFDIISRIGWKNVVIQTGRVNPEPYRRSHPEWIVFRFDPDFGRWLSGASLVITHFGQTVIDSVLTYRKPTVIVYNREWRTAASLGDARMLSRKLGAPLVEDLSLSSLLRAIEMAREAEIKEYPDGASRLANEILENYN
jgi:UDP-N-acetylglucosamine--N-acetylmuramyl-(pentapeptide) pyrophosphoryl-undecaprenol N-acetylglucosamine transferase